VWLALAGSVGAAALGLVRPALAASVLILAVLGVIGGARTLAGSAFGLDAAPEHRLAVTGIRAAATQFGYLVGSIVGGLALAGAGYGALGLAFAALYAAAAAPHALAVARPQRVTASRS
jgi:predicted MFS family arabinose efflux permease